MGVGPFGQGGIWQEKKKKAVSRGAEVASSHGVHNSFGGGGGGREKVLYRVSIKEGFVKVKKNRHEKKNAGRGGGAVRDFSNN